MVGGQVVSLQRKAHWHVGYHAAPRLTLNGGRKHVHQIWFFAIDQKGGAGHRRILANSVFQRRYLRIGFVFGETPHADGANAKIDTTDAA